LKNKKKKSREPEIPQISSFSFNNICEAPVSWGSQSAKSEAL